MQLIACTHTRGMAEQSISTPPCFLLLPGEPTITWKRSKKCFATYLLAIGGDKYSPLRKQAILLYHLDTEGRRIYDDLPEGLDEDVMTYVAALRGLAVT
ncbi:hypothetical protein NDU88_007635 [Pleurodeles waltl]|uniref:Uncharacterized protein n=1 Tax=Pleurodeles waltl TaxID=8319 RepID=A0AAV7PPX9_PLEWA|nr:hypothetical protein NDU88_007635 [Pleurodeles waltl]